MSLSSLMCVAATALIVVLAAWLGRDGPVTPAASDLDVYAHAWLCGGPRRVALTLVASLYRQGVLLIRPEPELDEFFLEVGPAAAAQRGLELRARDLLWRMWGTRGASLNEALPLLERLATRLRPALTEMRLVRTSARSLCRCVVMALALLPLTLLPWRELFAIGLPLIAVLGALGPRLAAVLTEAGRDVRARFRYRQLASHDVVEAVAALGAQGLPVDLVLCLIGSRSAIDSGRRLAVLR